MWVEPQVKLQHLPFWILWIRLNETSALQYLCAISLTIPFKDFPNQRCYKLIIFCPEKFRKSMLLWEKSKKNKTSRHENAFSQRWQHLCQELATLIGATSSTGDRQNHFREMILIRLKREETPWETKKTYFLLNPHTKIQVRFLSQNLVGHVDSNKSHDYTNIHDLHKINLNSTCPSSFFVIYSNQTTSSPPVAQICPRRPQDQWWEELREAPGSSTVEGGTSFSCQGHLCNEIDDLQMLLLVVTGVL